MKNVSIKTVLHLSGIFFLGTIASRAEVVSISDLDGGISVILTPALGATETIGARIGTWNASTSTFTSVGNSVGGGYFDNELKELSAQISSASNPVGFSSGTLLALAIYKAPSASDYSATFDRIILTDSNWVMPTLSFGLATKASYALTANTVAQVGTYSFNGGNQSLTLVPEPSTGALMMIGAAGLVALRRLRKV